MPQETAQDPFPSFISILFPFLVFLACHLSLRVVSLPLNMCANRLGQVT